MTSRTKKSNLDSAETVSAVQVPRTYTPATNTLLKIQAHLFEPEKLEFDASEAHQGYKIISSFDKEGKPVKYGQARLLYTYPNGERGSLSVEFSRLRSKYGKLNEKKQTLKSVGGKTKVEVDVPLKELTLVFEFDHPDNVKQYPKRKFYPDYVGDETVTLKEMIKLQVDPVDGFYAKLKNRLIELLDAYPTSKKYTGNAEERLQRCNLEPNHPKDKYTLERQTNKPICLFVNEVSYAYAINKETLEDVKTKSARFVFPIKGQKSKLLTYEELLNSELDLQPLLQFQYVRLLDKSWNCKGQIMSAIVYDIIPRTETDMQADTLNDAAEEQDDSHASTVLARLEARRMALKLVNSAPPPSKAPVMDTDVGSDDEGTGDLAGALDDD